MIKKTETVTLGWCDNGLTDGKFTEGLMTAVVAGPVNGININGSIRVQGNQIGRQRQALFDHWANVLKTDWLLWVDSDIVLSIETLQKLWQAADKVTRPIISGTYFISKENEGTLMRPFPVLFNDVDEHTIVYHHPLPHDQIIRCDCAGFGLVLMHKSIVPKMREANPGKGMFMETGDGNDDHFIGEDIIFFRRLKAAGIPLHAHTGALVKHMKRFSLDHDYYALYWNNEALKEQKAQEQKQGE